MFVYEILNTELIEQSKIIFDRYKYAHYQIDAFFSKDWYNIYSKALRYTASRSADLGDTRFLIGSQNTWDTRILAKSLEDTHCCYSRAYRGKKLRLKNILFFPSEYNGKSF